MLLSIDIGNTETVLGLFDHDALKAHWRLSSRTARTSDECWIMIKMWCESAGYDVSAIRGIVISSVVPSLTMVFRDVSRNRLDLEPLIVDSETDTGLEIAYENPASVGADRICNAVAGFYQYGAPLIVVDIGTATTLDVISESGVYLGGAIALGLASTAYELHRISAKLPRVEIRFPDSVVGRNTEASIQSGIMWGTVDLIDGMVDRIVREMKWKTVQVIGTGGKISMIQNQSATIQKVESFLTLQGMRIIYNRINHERSNNESDERSQ